MFEPATVTKDNDKPREIYSPIRMTKSSFNLTHYTKFLWRYRESFSSAFGAISKHENLVLIAVGVVL